MKTHNIKDIMKFIFSNKESALDQLSKNGLLLENMSSKLKEDKEVVLVAVRNNPRSFKFASEKLKADPEVVLEAISVQPNVERTLSFILWHTNEELVNQIGSNEPIAFLKSLVLKNMLFKELTSNQESNSKPVKI